MATETPNYKLQKPDVDDFYDVAVLNDNWDKLDAAVAGKADLDPSGKISAAQLPTMNYDPAGSAAAVQASVDAHTANRSNPHGVTAAQVGAMPVAGGAFAGHVSMPSLTLTNYGVPLEIGQFLDFHFPGSVADYNGRLHLGTDGHLYWGSTPLSVPDAQKSVAYAASAGNANTLGGLPASNFYTAANAPVVVGTYTGNGAEERLINLGFTPKAVLVLRAGIFLTSPSGNILYGGLAVTGNSAGINYNNLYSVILDAYGFVVGTASSTSGDKNSNASDIPYHYIAFR